MAINGKTILCRWYHSVNNLSNLNTNVKKKIILLNILNILSQAILGKWYKTGKASLQGTFQNGTQQLSCTVIIGYFIFKTQIRRNNKNPIVDKTDNLQHYIPWRLSSINLHRHTLLIYHLI